MKTLKKWMLEDIKYLMGHIDEPTKTIMDKLGRTASAIYSIRHLYFLWQAGKLNDPNFKRVVSFFTQVADKKTELPIVNDNPITRDEDKWDKLNRKYKELMDTVVEVAQDYAKEKAAEEVKITKDKYEKELQRLQVIIIEMKDSSLVGMLKRKFEGV